MATRKKNVPCDECAREKEHLQVLGFQVLDCNPDATDPGFCTIRFEDTASAAPLAAAMRPELVRLTAEDAPAASTATAALPPGMLTATQMRAAQAILNIFETSEVLGEYGNVTLIPHDSGHLTYGRSQTTLGSGNLALLVRQYCANAGARFAARLQEFLQPLADRDTGLDSDRTLHNLLRAAADDPVMRDTQDAFFDKVYWRPSVTAANAMGIASALGVAVVYDGHLHGSWALIRDRTVQAVGAPSAAGEQGWIARYVQIRRQWLATHPRPDLRLTVYRMDAFQRLIDQQRWGLDLPLVVRGREISLATLAAQPPGCYEGPAPGSRTLALQPSLQRGLDARLVQLALSDRDMDIKADGVFGQASANGVRLFQTQAGLPVNGIADPALIARLLA